MPKQWVLAMRPCHIRATGFFWWKNREHMVTRAQSPGWCVFIFPFVHSSRFRLLANCWTFAWSSSHSARWVKIRVDFIGERHHGPRWLWNDMQWYESVWVYEALPTWCNKRDWKGIGSNFCVSLGFNAFERWSRTKAVSNLQGQVTPCNSV